MRTLILILLVVWTAKADPFNWTVLSSQGVVATLKIEDTPMPNGKYLHTIHITPMITHLGIRLNCDGGKPQLYLLDDPTTSKFTDSVQASKWDFVFSNDWGNIQTYVRQDAGQ
jgi:hypothetical protein